MFQKWKEGDTNGKNDTCITPTELAQHQFLDESQLSTLLDAGSTSTLITAQVALP